MQEQLKNIKIEPLKSFSTANIDIDLLRLDLLHPIVSGNKWFKLRYYLEDAIKQGKNTIASFGGAYSNHLIAMAYAAKQLGLKSVGIIRGDASSNLSPTLLDAISYGMQPVFVNRKAYTQKNIIQNQYAMMNWYWINEGGYGIIGARGASTILQTIDTYNYTNIVCATGTGTMMAGLIMAASTNLKITGISVLKNNFSILNEIEALLMPEFKNKEYEIIHGYDFGGYAKHPIELIEFMNKLWQKENCATDIVYTSKLLFAVGDLIEKKYFASGSKVLVIHSGGIQGNRSLSVGQLIF